MAPATGIVVMRLLEKNGWQANFKQLTIPLTCAWCISMIITWADYRLAKTTHEAAKIIAGSYGGSAKPLWFQGHWGFQYYMEQNGASPYDSKINTIPSGQLMVIPENNTNIFPNSVERCSQVTMLHFTALPYLTVMNYSAGAGYHSSGFGPLPFLIDNGLEEIYHIFECR